MSRSRSADSLNVISDLKPPGIDMEDIGQAPLNLLDLVREHNSKAAVIADDLAPPGGVKPLEVMQLVVTRAGSAEAATSRSSETDAGTIKYSNQAQLDDGTYERDAAGRVTKMVSPDGKTTRVFKYEDAKNQNRITSETINDDETFKYLGPVTINNGQPVIDNGFEVNSYSSYDKQGNLTGNWSGIRAVSRNGVYSIKGSQQAEVEHFGADGKRLSDDERATRERLGIWPGRLEVSHDDGTKYAAKLTGLRLDSLTESKIVDGKPKDIVWTRDGEKFVSDENPQRQRKTMELRVDGSLRFEALDGTRSVIYKDGSSDQIADRRTKHFDKDGRLLSVTQENGNSRTFGYAGNDLTSIVESSKTGKRTWTRPAGSDEWSNGDQKETRKELQILADGAVQFKGARGNRIVDSKDFSRVEFDDKNRPLSVEFESGSTRKFKYDGAQLQSVTDTVKTGGKSEEKCWMRDGKTDNFFYDNAGRKNLRTIKDSPNADGDYKFTNADGKERNARAADVEKLARGEINAGSESVMEAKAQLLDVAKDKGLDVARLTKYLVDLEKNATKYDLKQEQLAKTLDLLSEVLTSTEKSPYYDDKDRKVIVETALHNVSRPMEIDQGYHPTCNVTTVEIYAAARHPEEYARLVKEIALTGKYKTSDGKVASPPKAALMPGEDERSYHLDKPNVEKRNFASQIVEMTLINALYELGGVVKDNKAQTDVRYVLGKISWKDLGNNTKAKIGEDKLVDLQGNELQKQDDGPAFTQAEVLASGKLLFAYEMPYIKNPYSVDDGKTWTYDLPDANRLLKAKADNKLPLGVPTIGGLHVQTIHDVLVDKGGTCWVLLDNQHGENKDGWVTLADLHKTQQDRKYECEPTIRRWQRPDAP